VCVCVCVLDHIGLLYIYIYIYIRAAHGGVVVKELRYKPAGRGFVSRWCHWNYSLT
jgi:hypothetical protein